MRLGLGALAVVLVATGALVAAPYALSATGLRTEATGAATVAPSVLAPSAQESKAAKAAPVGAGPALPPAAASASTPADPAALQKAITGVPKKFTQDTSAYVVADPATGRVQASANASAMLIPASNMKTLTAVAALAAMGEGHRFSTSVSAGQAGADGVLPLVLVGGGDPLLFTVPNPNLPEAATLQALARSTAAALKRQSVTTVTLGWEASVFSGPIWNPTWPAGYADQVAPVTGLSTDEGLQLDATGKQKPGTPRSTNPPQDAAAAFAAQLTAAGITVKGAPKAAPAAATGAAPLAKVSSLPLTEVVDWTMLHSDNYAAEVLLRQVAVAADQPGSFTDGAKAVQAKLTALGLWQSGAVIKDGSGLSRDNRVSAQMLATTWRHIARDPSSASLLMATPVAGVSGTLVTDRFHADQGAAAGRGWVHAKTGTLTKVSSLSGWTLNRAGRPVVLAVIVNNQSDDWWARAWIDQVASAVTGCSC